MEVSSGAPQPSESGAPRQESGAAHVNSIIDLLLTVAYVDGLFHHRERRYVRRYIEALLVGIERSASPGEAASLHAAWKAHLDDLYQRLDDELAAITDDPTMIDAPSEGPSDAPSPLQARAVSLFRTLPLQAQSTALELVHALIYSDGMITQPEHDLYERLTEHFATAPSTSAFEDTARMRTLQSKPDPEQTQQASLFVAAPEQRDLAALSHPLLDPLEQTYSPHPIERKSQIDWDYQLIQRAIAQWQRQRTGGAGRLVGMTDIEQIPVGARFLDGYVYVMRPSHPVELVVLGDLHGCYSCLKAALLQSNFIQRAWAHQWDPERYPAVKLILLGDYIDRGLFSFDGVLRAVLQLFVSMPDQVYVLRGNHEHLMRVGNDIFSCVHPAEAVASITPYVPIEMLEAYRILFEHMPTSVLVDRTMFVHAGIPRDDTFADRYRDLSSLNDPELRFQMMWSDPAPADHVPVDVQRTNPRFGFGRHQFKSFMERTGMHTMIRGHEQIESGFQVFYDLGEHALLSLFSAGGHDNADLPHDSSYRKVTPMALTMQVGHGVPRVTPWPLHYQPFNYPPHNGLYRPHPVLEFHYV